MKRKENKATKCNNFGLFKIIGRPQFIDSHAEPKKFIKVFFGVFSVHFLHL